MDVREDIGSNRSLIWDGFYENLIVDFLEYGRRSVIYGYYKDELLKDVDEITPEDKEPQSKKIEHILYEYKLMLKQTQSYKPHDFACMLLQWMTEKGIRYNYPNKIHDKKNDLIEICSAVKPFIIDANLREYLENNIDDPKITKSRLNKALSESVKDLSAPGRDIESEAIETLVNHVIDRYIFKAFDDFIYTAGYTIKQRDSDSSNEKKYERISADKGRKENKADKTLELIYRYYMKKGEVPFDTTDINNNEYAGICKSLFEHLLDSCDKKMPVTISIPLTVDPFTGCSLQILGNEYFDGVNRTGDAPLAYAVMGRNADVGSYVYEFYDYTDSDKTMLYDEFEQARLDYLEYVEDIKENMVMDNAGSLLPGKGLYEGIPGRFRFFFMGEEPEEKDDYEDTINDIMMPYDNEGEDPEFIPALGIVK